MIASVSCGGVVMTAPPERITLVIISYQLKLIKMRAKLANLNLCAVPFLSRAAANLYDYTTIDSIYSSQKQLPRKMKSCLVIRVCGLYFLAVVFAATKVPFCIILLRLKFFAPKTFFTLKYLDILHSFIF